MVEGLKKFNIHISAADLKKQAIEFGKNYAPDGIEEDEEYSLETMTYYADRDKKPVDKTKYFEYHSGEGEWGDENMVLTAAQYLGINICVIDPTVEQPQVFKVNDSNDAMWLWHPDNHYDYIDTLDKKELSDIFQRKLSDIFQQEPKVDLWSKEHQYSGLATNAPSPTNTDNYNKLEKLAKTHNKDFLDATKQINTEAVSNGAKIILLNYIYEYAPKETCKDVAKLRNFGLHVVAPQVNKIIQRDKSTLSKDEQKTLMALLAELALYYKEEPVSNNTVSLEQSASPQLLTVLKKAVAAKLEGLDDLKKTNDSFKAIKSICDVASQVPGEQSMYSRLSGDFEKIALDLEQV